ncbi:regulatory protein RecX [Rhodobacterales bacterium]|nr:regulatory protein RecX [Rhodobacterales bacterium]
MRDKPRYKLPTEDRLTRSALHYLERYSSSRANLRKVLERKVFKACKALEKDPAEFDTLIDNVIDKCVRASLVDDQSYAETKTASLRRRGSSRRKIEAHLSAKGVDRSTIETVLSSDSHDDETVALTFAKRRRLGPFRKPSEREERRDKDLAAMCRAGFSFDLARRVITAEPDPVDDESA